MAASISSRSVRVHSGGDLRIDGILRLIQAAAAARSLPAILATLCEEVSAIADAPIVSTYVREADAEGDVLVMRANVGFPVAAIGSVRLRMGEGITGFAAECMRPVTSALASEDVHYKPVPGIGEERYPCFLAVPLLSGGSALGVLVLQRPASRPFDPSEIVLATALAAPFVHAIESAKVRLQSLGGASPVGTSRGIRLGGHGLVPGRTVARARILPSLEELSEGTPVVSVEAAIGAVRKDMLRTLRRLGSDIPTRLEVALGALLPMLTDERFRSRAEQECGRLGVARGLRSVARAYAVTPFQVGGEDRTTAEWLAERAHEIEGLCLLLAARMHGIPICRPGEALVVAGRLGTLLSMSAVSARASAVVVGDDVDEDALPCLVLREVGIPAVSEVGSLFDWVRPGDRLLVDGLRGSVRVNPAALQIAKYRAEL